MPPAGIPTRCATPDPLHLALDLDQPGDQARAEDGLAHAELAQGNPGQVRHHWQAALDLLSRLAVNHTEEPEVTITTVRAHLRTVDNPSRR